MFASSHEWRRLLNAYGVKACCVDWSCGVFASCITRVQLYVNVCNWMAAVCAAAPLALANQLPLTRSYSTLVRSSRKLRYIRIRPLPLPSVQVFQIKHAYGASVNLLTEFHCNTALMATAHTLSRCYTEMR